MLLRRTGVAVLTIALLMTVSCRSARDRGYVGNFADAAVYVDWTDNDGSINGQLQLTQVEDGEPPQVESKNLAFTGTLDRERVSLTFEEFFGLSKRTITGQLRGGKLELTWPDDEGNLQRHVLQAGSIEDYNRLAKLLRARVEDARREYGKAAEAAAAASQEQAAQADLSRQLQKAFERLKSSIETLADETDFSDVTDAFERDWSVVQQENRDMKNSSDCSDVEYEFSSVEYAYSTIEYDMSSMGYQREKVQGYISQVQKDRTELTAAFQAVEAGAPSPSAERADVDSLVGRAKEQIDSSQTALNAAQAKADDYERKAGQLLESARTYASQHGC